MRIFIILGKFIEDLSRGMDKLKKIYLISQLKKVGKHCYIGRNVKLSPETICLGDYVSIQNGCVIQSKHGEIIIGDHVMFGPNVHIHGGNHKIHEIGSYMDDVEPKIVGCDGKIVIENDVWIGACSIILKGVHIGKGSVIGAGSIVIKDVPPYSIYTNKIEPVLRKRFSDEELLEHEKKIAEKYKTK